MEHWHILARYWLIVLGSILILYGAWQWWLDRGAR